MLVSDSPRAFGARPKSSGGAELLGLAPQIRCPVVAIHGDYDPHPAEGIQSPLSSAVNDFRFILLKNCGHLPWIERQAKDEFFALLRRELQSRFRTECP